MSKTKDENKKGLVGSSDSKSFSRRKFLQFAGASAAAAATFGLVGCDTEDEVFTPPGGNDGDGDPQPGTVNLGSGDVGVLNLAYALEQLEAAFYIRATSDNGWMQSGDGSVFADIRDHEIAHRDWFNAVIEAQAGADARIPDLTLNFDNVDFSNRDSVLSTAIALEDTGVGAYNGAGAAISMTDAGAIYLLQAGKIVSVEARHAAAVRDLRDGGVSFAGDDIVTTDNGLDVVLTVAQALENAGPFIAETIDASSVGQ